MFFFFLNERFFWDYVFVHINFQIQFIDFGNMLHFVAGDGEGSELYQYM
jgi:hypothetical protein